MFWEFVSKKLDIICLTLKSWNKIYFSFTEITKKMGFDKKTGWRDEARSILMS